MGTASTRGTSRRLPLPPDARVEDALRSLGRDPASPTERRTARGLVRTAVLDGRPALVHLVPAARTLGVRVEARGAVSARALDEAARLARRLFGLDDDVPGFERVARRTADGRRLIRGREGLRVPRTPDVWEAVVWAIVGQQVNLAFAFTCRARLIERCGRRAPGGLRTHPTPAEVARLDPADLTAMQYSRRKAEYLVDTARAVAAGALDLDEDAAGSEEDLERRLLAVRGLGPWSANYVLMRGHGLPDRVPVGDVGLQAALVRHHGLEGRPDAARTLQLLEPYRPHRSLAVFHLWKTLGDPP